MHCQILGISICFVELGYPRSLIRSPLLAGLHFSDPTRRLAGNARLKALMNWCDDCLRFQDVFVESPSLLARMASGVASLQRLWLALTRAIRVATKARVLMA
jgi:hypothetical protein